MPTTKDTALETVTHTPGPWTATGMTVLSPDDRRTRFAIAEVRGRTTPEQQANSRLIAAAPEMLQALREVAACCYVVLVPADVVACSYCGEGQGEPHDHDCTMQFVNAAIEKAEARS